MRDAYLQLHRRGLAHSVETWIDGELAGFAAERGLDVDSVRASLNAWGGLAARPLFLFARPTIRKAGPKRRAASSDLVLVQV